MDKRMSTVTRDGTTVTVSDIKKRNVIAGEVRVTASVAYVFEDGSTDTGQWQVQGSVYGGPVVTWVGASQVFVRNPERFGSFAEDPREWMRRFALGDEPRDDDESSMETYSLGSCGCVDYHMADCPTRTAAHDEQSQADWDPYGDER